MNRIILKIKGQVVSEVPFKGKAVTIGRAAGNDIKIDNPAVSSRHARIFRDKKMFVIEDLDSSNGTFLNGARVKKSVINSTDEIIIGKHQLQLGWEEGTDGFDKELEEGAAASIVDSLDKTMVISSTSKGGAKSSSGILSVMDGKVVKKRIELKDRITTIGKSSDAQVPIKGMFAPKVAALINKTDKGYYLAGSDSKKPPTVNGKAASNQHLLKNGDIIEVAGMIFRFDLKK